MTFNFHFHWQALKERMRIKSNKEELVYFLLDRQMPVVSLVSLLKC